MGSDLGHLLCWSRLHNTYTMLTSFIDYVSAGWLSGQRSMFGLFGAFESDVASSGWLNRSADIVMENVSVWVGLCWIVLTLCDICVTKLTWTFFLSFLKWQLFWEVLLVTLITALFYGHSYWRKWTLKSKFLCVKQKLPALIDLQGKVFLYNPKRSVPKLLMHNCLFMTCGSKHCTTPRTRRNHKERDSLCIHIVWSSGRVARRLASYNLSCSGALLAYCAACGYV